jgi:two-component system, OmpR family, sensor histidine kinase KdpD
MFMALQNIQQRFWRFAATVFLVAFTTLVDFKLRFNAATTAFTFILLVLGLATRVGRNESILASVLSVLAYNFFFLPPIGKLTISDPQNWIALVVFLVTSFTVSHLSNSAQRRAKEANRQRGEAEQVYEFSRALLIADQERSLVGQLPEIAVETFGWKDVAFFDLATGKICHAGDHPELFPESALRLAARQSSSVSVPNSGTSITPISLGGRVYGALGISESTLSGPALQAVSQLTAIAIERARAQEEASRAEITRQHERLKSTLLDALAHEFKTPLTSIKAAASSVLSRDSLDTTDKDLLTVIDEECDHLNSLVSEAITVARIGAGQVRIHREAASISELAGAAITQLKRFAEGRDVRVNVEDSLPLVEIDPSLTALALRQLLSNAFKYAPVTSPIYVSARAEGNDVVMSVSNDGPPIPLREQAAIFEKFYRGHDAREKIPGTGMGLTIARDIIQAQGGRIWVDSGSSKGVCFSFTLPVTSTAALSQS